MIFMPGLRSKVRFGNDAFTKSLLQFDNNFTDIGAAGTPPTWTNNGGVTFTTSSKFGSHAGLFSGSGQWLSGPVGMFPASTADFTEEIWFYVDPTGNGSRRYFCGDTFNAASSAAGCLGLGINTSNVFIGEVLDSSLNVFTINSGQTITSAGWHHAALVRVGNVVKLFLDGVQYGGDLAFTSALFATSEPFTIGRSGAWASPYFKGALDGHRSSPGIARWTANFTPPATPYG